MSITDAQAITSPEDVLTVTIAGPARDVLIKLVANTGRQVGDLLTEAIGVEEWVEGVRSARQKVFVQGKDGGTLQEVVFPATP